MIKKAACFGCIKQPSSGFVFQNCVKKGNHIITAAILSVTKLMGKIPSVREMFVEITCGKNFYNM
jgi:hypothetical protein